MRAPNQPAAGIAGITSVFRIEHRCPGLPEPGRWPMIYPWLIVVIAFSYALRVVGQSSIPTEVRFEGATYRTTGLYRAGSGEFFHVEYYPAGQTSRTAAKLVEFFRQPLSTDRLDQLIDTHLETANQWKPKGGLTVCEKADDHLVLKEARFDGKLSGRPSFSIYIYELNDRTLLSSQFTFTPCHPFDTPESFSKEIAEKQTTWLKDLREVSRAVQEVLAKEANKGGAANRSQPVPPETKQQPPAAGSRR